MCDVLNRLLTLSPELVNELLHRSAITSSISQAKSLLDDDDIVVAICASGVQLTPLLLINSLVSETREFRVWSIFRDVDEKTGETINFFVAPVNRSKS